MVNDRVTRRRAVASLVASAAGPYIDTTKRAASCSFVASNFFAFAQYGSIAAAIAAGEAATEVGSLFSVDDGEGLLFFRVKTINGSVEISQTVTPAALLQDAGARKVGYKLPAYGAVLRTVEDMIVDRVSPKDFGAIGDGTIDDTEKIQAWLNAYMVKQLMLQEQPPAPSIQNNAVVALELPDGIYRVGNLTFTGAVFRMRSHGGAIIKFNPGCGLRMQKLQTADVYGVTFVGGGQQVHTTNNNLEGGYYVFERCRFLDSTDWPLNFEPDTPNAGYLLNHLSGMCVIKDCLWYNTNGCMRHYFDKAVVDNGYATLFRSAHSANSRLQAGRAAFESRSLGDGIELRGFFGTPICDQGSDDNVWIDNYPGFKGAQSAPDTPEEGYGGDTALVSYGGGVCAHDCRFGAEEGGMPIIRNWCHGIGGISRLGNVHLAVENCGLMAAGNGGNPAKVGVVVLKKGVPNSITIKGGSGPVGAPLVNASAMQTETGAASSLSYWLDGSRNRSGRYWVDIIGNNNASVGSLPPELLSAAIVEASGDGLTREKIMGRLGIRSNIRLYNNENAVLISSEAFGGALRLRSSEMAASDRGVQIGYVDDAGNYSGFWDVSADGGAFAPVINGGVRIGSGSRRVNTIFLQSAPDVLSDERLQNDIARISDKVLDAWGDVEYAQYRFLNNDKISFGVIAQQVVAAFQKHGLNALDYDLVRLNEWEAYTRNHPPKYDNSGEIIEEARVELVPAGKEYSINYIAVSALEAKWTRRQIDRIAMKLNL